MSEAGDPSAKVDVDQLIELATKLENVEKASLRQALKGINYTARTERIDMYLGHVTTALGTLVAGGAVAAFLWVAHTMVEAHEAGYGVLLCGLPASSIAGIFVIRKLPDFRALVSAARQVQAGQAQAGQAQTGQVPAGQQPVDQVPPARPPIDASTNPADQTGGAV
ncbi:hypothetical protein ABZ920_18245 [Streptomyces sp. NPDC046831]|uniref:hypothetical protein n=1 Tax=Streptomyces sp. NPDC046831 TaxID=3154805 RepID=UPI0033F6E80C